MIALECNGVIKYARGARSCAQQECMNISARIVRNNSLMMPLWLFAILDKPLPLTIPPSGEKHNTAAVKTTSSFNEGYGDVTDSKLPKKRPGRKRGESNLPGRAEPYGCSPSHLWHFSTGPYEICSLLVGFSNFRYHQQRPY